MSSGDGLRLLMIVIGVAIIVAAIISLARRNMTESFCIAWGVVAVGAIFAGIVLRPTEWSHYVSWHGLVLIVFGAVLMLAAAFYFTLRISQLNRAVKELSIRVALLSQENTMILNELSGDAAVNETQENEEKALIRH